MAMRITVASSAAEMEALAPLWRELYAVGGGADMLGSAVRSPSCTLFQSYEWNLLAAKIFAARERPAVVAARSDSGAAIIPACIAENGLKFLGDELFDYPGILHAGDNFVAARALEELAQIAPQESTFSCHGLRRESQTPFAEIAGVQPQSFAAAPFLSAQTDPAEFETQHLRSARALRRLTRMGAELRRRSGAAEPLARKIYEMKALQSALQQANLFADSARRMFLIHAAKLPPSRCEIFTLEIGATLIAALVTFAEDRAGFSAKHLIGLADYEDRVRRFYTTYYDRAWARHSPGVALLFAASLATLREGQACDYMTGEQPYKMRFATASLPLYKLDRAHLSALRERELLVSG